MTWYRCGSRMPERDLPEFSNLSRGGHWFDPCHAHHPVLPNRRFPGRAKIGRFCGVFRCYPSALSVSGDACGLAGPILRCRLRIQKFRSRGPVAARPIPLGSPEMLGVFGTTNRPFEPGHVLSRVQSEGFELLAPFCRSITKSLDSNTAWQTTFDSGPHEIWREEGE
jgi:hypothetical protein